MIDAVCVDCPYCKVESADAGQDSYKAAHDWSDSIGKILMAADGTLPVVASSSPTGS